MLSLLLYVFVLSSTTSAQIVNIIKMFSMTDGLGGGVDDLEVAYSPSTAAEHFVLATGNASVIAALWSALAMDNGRIVSDGDFYDLTTNRWRHYVAIHKYKGSVFLRPAAMNYSELVRLVDENPRRSSGLTRVCGREVVPNSGQVSFSTYWERISNVTTRLWFPGTPNAETEKAQYEQQGFRPTHLCGYSVQGCPQYVGIWQQPTLTNFSYVMQYNLTLADCLAKDRELKQQGYTAIKFQVFNSANQLFCTAIWEQRPGACSYRIEMDKSVAAMHRRILPDTTMLPRQISHYIDPADNCVKYAVLWSNINSFRYPDPPPFWPRAQPIPKIYLPGSTTGFDVTQIAFLERRVERFMQAENIPGLSIAITKNESLKFAVGFGWANGRQRIQLDPSHQFRIGVASVPITAAAVLLLVEQGKLQLDQKVFGVGSILGTKYVPTQSQLNQQQQVFKQMQNYLCNITVRHLLEQTTGKWASNIPTVIEPFMNNDDFIRYIVDNLPVEDIPGTQWSYSNFNYLLLGKIIETVTGQSYEQYVKSSLWAKAGVTEARIQDPFISQLGPKEVMYYSNPQNGTGEGGDPYIALPKERVAAFGGWVVTPTDLLRLLVRLDGFKNKPDILSDASIQSWSTSSLASNDTYGQGWFLNINGWNGWVSVGREPGTTSLLVRLNNGVSFAILTNKDYSGKEFYHQLGYVMHHIISMCKKWMKTDGDLFCAQGSNCP